MASVISKSLVERPRFMWAVLPMHHKGYGERDKVEKEGCGIGVALARQLVALHKMQYQE